MGDREDGRDPREQCTVGREQRTGGAGHRGREHGRYPREELNKGREQCTGGGEQCTRGQGAVHKGVWGKQGSVCPPPHDNAVQQCSV